jgi:hypothetical protein
VLPDESLPGQGPGRAVNGNFMLTGLRLWAGAGRTPVAFSKAAADFEQTRYGNWPAAAALDADPLTGWSIDPGEGLPHAAVFETVEPFGEPGGGTLTLELDQGERAHALGRFRLWATSVPGPQLPAGYADQPWRMTGQVPQTRDGGLLVVSMDLRRDGKSLEVPNLGSKLSVAGTMNGRPASFEPALGQQTYPAAWQSWRLACGPESAGKPFELIVRAHGLKPEELRWSAHFIPQGRRP